MSKRVLLVLAYAVLLFAVMFYSAYGFYRAWARTGTPHFGWLGGLMGTLPVIWVATLGSLRGDPQAVKAKSRMLLILVMPGACLSTACWVSGETPNLNPLTAAWLAFVGFTVFRHLIRADVPDSAGGG